MDEEPEQVKEDVRAWMIPISFLDPRGSQVEVDLKVSTTENSQHLRWELRRLLSLAGYKETSNHRDCQNFKEQLPTWRAHFEILFPGEGLWGSSDHRRESLARVGVVERIAGEGASDAQAWLDTRGLLIVFLHWCFSRRGGEKPRCRVALLALLVRLVHATAVSEVLDQPSAAICELCDNSPDENGVCNCLRGAMRTVQDPLAPPQLYLRESLLCLFAALHCPASVAYLAEILHRIRVQGDDIIPVIGDDDILHHSSVSLPGPCGGKRKYDADYKRAVAWEAHKLSKTKSSGALAQVLGQGDASTARVWEEQQTAHYHAGLHLAMTNPCVFGQTGDGVRIGQPAVEHHCFTLWNARNNSAGFLAPQALHANNRTGRLSLERKQFLSVAFATE